MKYEIKGNVISIDLVSNSYSKKKTERIQNEYIGLFKAKEDQGESRISQGIPYQLDYSTTSKSHVSYHTVWTLGTP